MLIKPQKLRRRRIWRKALEGIKIRIRLSFVRKIWCCFSSRLRTSSIPCHGWRLLRRSCIRWIMRRRRWVSCRSRRVRRGREVRRLIWRNLRFRSKISTGHNLLTGWLRKLRPRKRLRRVDWTRRTQFCRLRIPFSACLCRTLMRTICLNREICCHHSNQSWMKISISLKLRSSEGPAIKNLTQKMRPSNSQTALTFSWTRLIQAHRSVNYWPIRLRICNP